LTAARRVGPYLLLPPLLVAAGSFLGRGGPDLAFIFALWWGFERGSLPGLAMGVLVGLAEDLWGGRYIGVHSFGVALLGYVAGLAGKVLFLHRPFFFGFLCLLAVPARVLLAQMIFHLAGLDLRFALLYPGLGLKALLTALVGASAQVLWQAFRWGRERVEITRGVEG